MSDRPEIEPDRPITGWLKGLWWGWLGLQLLGITATLGLLVGVEWVLLLWGVIFGRRSTLIDGDLVPPQTGAEVVEWAEGPEPRS